MRWSAKIHDISQYLGDEAVVVGVKQADHPGFAVLADVEKSGLADLLKTQAADPDVHGDLTVLDEQSLAAATAPANNGHAAYALVRSHEVVFSNDIALLKQLNAQLNARRQRIRRRPTSAPRSPPPTIAARASSSPRISTK